MSKLCYSSAIEITIDTTIQIKKKEKLTFIARYIFPLSQLAIFMFYVQAFFWAFFVHVYIFLAANVNLFFSCCSFYDIVTGIQKLVHLTFFVYTMLSHADEIIITLLELWTGNYYLYYDCLISQDQYIASSCSARSLSGYLKVQSLIRYFANLVVSVCDGSRLYVLRGAGNHIGS